MQSLDSDSTCKNTEKGLALRNEKNSAFLS